MHDTHASTHQQVPCTRKKMISLGSRLIACCKLAPTLARQMWRHNDVIDGNEYLIFTLSESVNPWVYSLQFLFKSTNNSWRYERKCEWVFFSEHSVFPDSRCFGSHKFQIVPARLMTVSLRYCFFEFYHSVSISVAYKNFLQTRSSHFIWPYYYTSPFQQRTVITPHCYFHNYGTNFPKFTFTFVICISCLNNFREARTPRWILPYLLQYQYRSMQCRTLHTGKCKHNSAYRSALYCISYLGTSTTHYCQ